MVGETTKNNGIKHPRKNEIKIIFFLPILSESFPSIGENIRKDKDLIPNVRPMRL
jgi:hypothetical protein